MKRICRIMKENTGMTMVGALVATLMCIVILLTCISVLAFFSYYNEVQYICRKMVRTIEVSGLVDEQTYTVFEQLKDTTGKAKATMTVDATYFDTENTKIQLRNTFTVTVTDSYTFRIFNVSPDSALAVEIPIRIKYTGVSEKYWK